MTLTEDAIAQIRAFAEDMARDPDDQGLRDVLSDLLLELGAPNAEAKAVLLREGVLTGRHPWKAAWGGFVETVVVWATS